MTTLSPSEQATIDAHFQHAQTTNLMPVPNLVEKMTTQRDEAYTALRTLKDDYQALLAELRAVKQHANEPAVTRYDCSGLGCGFQPCICDPLPTVRQAPSLMDNLDPQAFTDPDLAPAEVPPRVMPARALRHDRQAIGLLW